MDNLSSNKRVAIGGILHETHTFLEQQTTLADFQAQALYSGDDLLRHLTGTRSGIGGMIDGAQQRGWTILPTVYGAAMPGGTVSDAAYNTLKNNLLEKLSAAMPIDGVLLALHGAMVTEHRWDVESDIVAGVRQIVGPNVPIVVELDMHGNLSQNLVDQADVLVAYDTNPHLDMVERGLEAAAILDRLMKGEIKPASAFRSPSILLSPQSTGTSDVPLSLVHQQAAQMETDPAVIAVCVMGGFAYADTPYTGASLVVTTNNQPELAARYADELSALLYANRDAALPALYSPAEAVDRALNWDGGPVILVDSADNVGGGSPGDGTDALRAMLDRHVQEGTIVLADPEAVRVCWDAGIGAQITLQVGGKADHWHGQPVEVSGEVHTLTDGVFECEAKDNHFAAFYGTTMHMGRTAWLRVGGVNIVLTERKTPPADLAQLRSVGIVPERQHMIVVKSAVAYRAAYLPIAAGVVEMDTAGLCSANVSRFPYQHLPRPCFPLD